MVKSAARLAIGSPAARFLVSAWATSTMLVASSLLYVSTPLPVPSGSEPGSVVFSGLNNSGQVTGYAMNGSTTQALLGSTAGSVFIPLPTGWSWTTGSSLNDSGQVTGLGYPGSGNGTLAFIGGVTNSTAIPPLSGAGILQNANAINNAGQVTGDAIGGQPATFVATTAGSTVIPSPPGWTYLTNAAAINASGQVAGAGFNGLILQAFVGTTTGTQAVPLPTGWLSSDAVAINDSGVVVGFGNNGTGIACLTCEVTAGQQAFIGTTAGSMAIPLPPGATYAHAVGVNADGTVIGNSDAGAWIWDAINGTRLLSALSQTGLTVGQAFAINNADQILANVFDSDPFSGYAILTPTSAPEPSGYCLFGLCLLLLGKRSRSKVDVVGISR
jgi:hypothetical protein